MSDLKTTLWFENDLTCKPLSTLKDIQLFIFDPPAWRSLCQPFTPHSTSVIKNMEVNPHVSEISLEKPQNFCHFDPEKPSVARHDEKKLPKLLICHDMANGYHDDCFIDGTTNYQAYNFYNWGAVDIFCYFSHHLVTIPPLGWINVAHAHGVKVIGTFITEWAEGVAFWKKIMAEPLGVENLVSWLVTIAKTLKFEGWLINIENKISEPDELLKFLKLLHKTLHQEIPGAEVIWYDSVTKDGHLSWQNALNQNNRQFFDACDGIFTNYSWTERNISQSVQEAGSRIRDLYIGIDVWGRNFYGGGMFNTQEAVQVVYDYGCSMAIFAPAWTHEAMPDAEDDSHPQHIVMGGDLEKHERFLLRDEALWGSLWPYFKTKLPCALPFKTSFCRGLGIKRRMYGEVLCNSPWYNIRHMQYQPNSMLGAHGYLLSNNEKIKTVSRNPIKDNRGILKLRQSLLHFDTIVKKMKEDESVRKVKLGDLSDAEIDKELRTEGTEITKDDEMKKEQGGVEGKRKRESEENEPERRDGDKNVEDEEHKNKFPNQKSSFIVVHEKQGRLTKMKNVFKRIIGIKKKKVEEIPEESNVVGTTAKTDKGESSEISKTNKEESAGASSQSSKVVTLQEQEESKTLKTTDNEPKELTSQHSSESNSLTYISSGRSMIHAPVRFSLVYDKLRLSLAFVHEERHCIKAWYGDSFNGGTCLKIFPSDQVSEDHRWIRLFQSDFIVQDRLVVCMVTKVLPGFTTQWLDMWLYVLLEGGEERRCQLVGRPSQGVSVVEGSLSDNLVYPLDHGGADFKELQTYLVVYEPGFYVPIENSFGWNIFYYQVPLGRSRVTSINLRTGRDEGPILLGHVGLCGRTARRPSTFNYY